MNVSTLLALLLTLTAAFAYINARWFRLPSAVGVMGMSLTVSLLAIVGERAGLPLRGWAAQTVGHINFSEALLNGMLSFMLFAGALHVDLDELRQQKLTVAALATVGVLLSTLVVGVSSWAVFHELHLSVPLLACFTFGALISPTDPIAVMGLLKRMSVSKALSTKIAGESLLNDGVGIVLFLLALRIWTNGSQALNWQHTALLLLREVGGGIGIGVVLGGLCFLLLRSIDQYQVELMLTLALVSGGYDLALHLQTSGALAIVAAGLVVGNFGRHFAMSKQTRHSLDLFWETLDYILNGVLFVLIGLQVLLLQFKPGYLIAALCIVPLIVAARLLSLALPLLTIRMFGKEDTPLSILTWGGLRGGISIALALSLPSGVTKDLFVVATYSAVAFSILVQATTMPLLLRKVLGPNGRADSGAHSTEGPELLQP